MSVFTAHTAETAPAAARRSIEGVRGRFGWLPTPVALMADSPQLLTGFLTASAGFEQTDLAPLDREVVILTISTSHECHFCVALHTGKLTQLGATPELITALRAGSVLPEPRLEALRRFTLAVLDHRGAVPDDELDALPEPPATSPDTRWTWCSASARTPCPPSPTGSPGHRSTRRWPPTPGRPLRPTHSLIKRFASPKWLRMTQTS